MSTHNVRGTASGEYECSCGARWDRDEGDECPLGRVEGKKLAHDNEMLENARVAALNGTLPEPKEAVSADDDPVNLKPIQIGAVERLQEELLKRGMAIVKIDFMESMAQEISSKQATIDGMNEAHWKVVQELAALKAQPSGVVLPPSPYMPDTEPASMTDYERGEAQGRCDMWTEVKRLNPSTASAGDERAAFEAVSELLLPERSNERGSDGKLTYEAIAHNRCLDEVIRLNRKIGAKCLKPY